MPEKSSPIPNFLIVGTAKAGTSSLWHWLKSHPQVFMSDPVKEPYYFLYGEEQHDFQYRDWRGGVPEWATNWEKYLSLFEDAAGAKVIGEASVNYLYHPGAPEKIARRLGKPKIIALLRDPIARGYSHYTFNRMRRIERAETFAEAVRLERELTNPYPGIAYLGMGLYADMLERYFGTFGRENVLVLTFEELTADRTNTLKKVFDFLEIDANHVPSDEIHNETLRENAITNALYFLKGSNSILGKVFHWLNHRLVNSRGYIHGRRRLVMKLRKLATKFGAVKPDRLDAATRAELLPLVSDDVARVEALLARDLSAWRS